MNNNNLYNTNNFIGITHNDYFKSASNALSYQIFQTSNTLESHLNYTSNILDMSASNFTTTTSNIILARYDPLIKEQIENIILPAPTTLKHTYIMNSNLLGEIRFWCKSTKDFIVVNPLGVPDYRVKIDVDGKLKVYYTYDPAINLTFFNGWVDVGNSIAALNASDANIGIAIGGLEGQVSANFDYLEGQVAGLLAALLGHNVIDAETYDNINEFLDLYKTNEFIEPNSINNVFTNIKNAFNTARINYLNDAITGILYNISLNPVTASFLGIGGVAFGFAVGYIQNQGYLNTISARINEKLSSNTVISSTRRADVLASNSVDIINTYTELCSNMYNFSIAQGFINSNIQTQQHIPSLNTNELKLNYSNINNIFVASNVLSNLNINQGFINSNIQTQQHIPSLNTNELKLNYSNINNIFVASNVLSNLNINQGFINSNIQTQQYIKDLKCDTLNLNTGNINNINGINANEIIAQGKIKQNNILLDDTYLTSNHIYNLAYNYTAERQYPSKLYNTILQQDTITLGGLLKYRTGFYLDNQSIAYGSGVYEIYYSSQYDTNTRAENLFNYDTSQTTTSARFGITLYSSGTGDYLGNDKINNYYGDWVIIKMNQEILLSRYRIYQRTDAPTKAPSLWKVFGSKDGITFTEITQASQTTRLTSYTNNYYEKTLSSFTTLYQYFGFVFGSLLSVSGQTDLSFAELQIFGKEIINSTITSQIYTTSNVVKGIVRNEMNDVGKRQAFIIEIPTSSIFVDATTSTTFYKWDLDLTKYTRTQVITSIPYTGDLMRIFRIRFWYVPSYFGSYLDGHPYVNSYEIYMSNKSNPVFARPETVGINIFTIGDPVNVKLNNILPNKLFLLKNFNSNFNYLTIVSRDAPASIYVIIEDLLF